MKVTINEITKCAGGDHIFLSITVADETYSVTIHKEDFEIEPSTETFMRRLTHRIRFALKDQIVGKPTFNQIKSLLEGQELNL